MLKIQSNKLKYTRSSEPLPSTSKRKMEAYSILYSHKQQKKIAINRVTENFTPHREIQN